MRAAGLRGVAPRIYAAAVVRGFGVPLIFGGKTSAPPLAELDRPLPTYTVHRVVGSKVGASVATVFIIKIVCSIASARTEAGLILGDGGFVFAEIQAVGFALNPDKPDFVSYVVRENTGSEHEAQNEA